MLWQIRAELARISTTTGTVYILPRDVCNVLCIFFVFLRLHQSPVLHKTTIGTNPAEESMNECRPIREFQVSDVTALDGRTKIHVSEGTTTNLLSVPYSIRIHHPIMMQNADHNPKASVRNSSKHTS